MIGLFERCKVFSIFWICLLFYFVIPYLIDPIPCPPWVSYFDQHIPFLWWMVIPYYSYYLLLVFFPFGFKGMEELKLARNTLLQLTFFSFFIFMIFPISSTPVLMSVDRDNPLAFMHEAVTFSFLHQNAFPSLHVAISSLMAFIFFYEKSYWKNAFGVFSVGIFLATFFIKQHYFWDSISGLFVSYLFYRRYKHQRELIKVETPKLSPSLGSLPPTQKFDM